MVPKKDAKDLIYGTCHNVEVLRRANTKRKPISEMGEQAGEVFRTRHAQGRDGKLGNYRLC